jgi:formate dehydrogenase beta subunit
VTDFVVNDGIGLSKWNTIEVANPLTGETTKEGVFAGGDAVTGASIAVEAIGAGRRAARSIHCYLRGETSSVPETVITNKSRLPDVDKLHAVNESDRVHMPELKVDDRRLSFQEVELGLDEHMAKDESARCLQCGLICYRKEG